TFPWGTKFEVTNANTAASGRNGPAPVGSYPGGATPQGVQDLIGNVWEWTASAMGAYPGAPAMPDSMGQFRVIRGGAFDSRDDVATGWFRGFNFPSTDRENLKTTGFRCARYKVLDSNQTKRSSVGR